MKKLPSYKLIILLSFLLLVVVFFALDFKVAFSTISVDSQVTTISSGNSYVERPPIVIFVQAPNNLAEPLRQGLLNQVGTLAPFSTIALTETPASDPGSAALVVIVDPHTYIWTPFYASANLSVRIAFASDGQVDWDQIGEIDTVMVSDPEVRMTADLEARDRSLGLISHPGYRSYLAKQISDKVVETINTALVGSTP